MNLKVLYIEDNQPDVELAKSMLADSGIECDMTVIEVEAELRSALEECQYDVILSDCSLPAYNGIAALSVARAMCPQTPFIFVSGTLGEETAIECVKFGATDYVLKDRLSRLPPVVRRALDETEARRRHEKTLQELEASREAFYQAQKMETVGRLTAGIAHDFNNMLTVIIGYAEMIRTFSPQDDSIRGYTDQIMAATRRAAELVEHLLSYSRNQRLSLRPVDMNDEIRTIVNMIQKLVGDLVRVETDLADDLWIVEIDTARFAQIAMNLAANARDAMPGGGTFRIETRNAKIDPSTAGAPAELGTGDFVVIRFRDNGSGMDQEILNKIFEPFFTTKEPGKGTGLGLASSYGIVKQSGGTITVSSEVGEGTTFEVYMPRSATALEPLPHQEADETPRGPRSPTEHILLIDDDLSVLNFIKLVLENNGYTVSAASSATAARALAAEQDARIGIIVMDVVMPDVSSADLVDDILRYHPGTPVLYTSGYAETAERDLGFSAEKATVIRKPIQTPELLAAIRAKIDRSRTQV